MAVLTAVGGVSTLPAVAYETDQYSCRLQTLADSTEALNLRVNQALARVAGEWSGPPGSRRFAARVFTELGGVFWVDAIERWAMKAAVVDGLPWHRWSSIYGGAPVWATRVNFFFGVGRTIKVNGSLVGTDKLGHFFSQGFKYYRRHLEGWPVARVLRWGRLGERWIFGQATTGVFSNADLVANYEGFLFYRSLFEDGVVAPGKPAIVAWREGRPVLQRPFDWRDHVNDYWDEALNPSWFSGTLQRHMDRALHELCPEYRQRPGAFVSSRDAELRRRYTFLGLKPAPHNRLDRICADSLR